MRPDPRTHKEFVMCDPACGTGGFLVSSYEWLMKETKGGALPRDLAKRLKSDAYFGQELVQRPRRLTLMNLYLHGLEPHIAFGDSIYEIPSGQRYDVVMTNPPFGTKGANQAPTRDDFTISTSNKQLNFIQHVMTILKPGGRAAVVVPDNCLFADQAGDVFKILTEDCSLHTVLRLPNGTFTPYSPGTKTNVIFFTELREMLGCERAILLGDVRNIASSVIQPHVCNRIPYHLGMRPMLTLRSIRTERRSANRVTRRKTAGVASTSMRSSKETTRLTA